MDFDIIYGIASALKNLMLLWVTPAYVVDAGRCVVRPAMMFLVLVLPQLTGTVWHLSVPWGWRHL
jgi:hypothetical protein